MLDLVYNCEFFFFMSVVWKMGTTFDVYQLFFLHKIYSSCETKVISRV